ncbi:MAG: LuxR C-terminal-related transcriptional regulator [Oscillospiraceae bacterium]|nr:LuxR C-terminal-related transcriptional regulator [Oscillospiraceae bacterium]
MPPQKRDQFLSNRSAITEHHTLLERPQLHGLLAKALQYPLTTVVAAAGYGKTQSVYAFLRNFPAVKLWIQLSPQDNLIEHFWESFTNAIAARNPALAARLTAIGFPESKRQLVRYRNLLEQSLCPACRYVLVLDDFHLLQNTAVLHFVEASLSVPPAQLSVLLLSRREPAFNLLALRAKGIVFSLEENDLRFDCEELCAYLRLLGVALSPQAAAELTLATGGWPFAIHLLGLALKKDPRRQAAALSAVKTNLFKLMEATIFSVVSPSLQRLLVKLSLLDQLPASLLRTLAVRETLVAELERSSSFVRYDAFTDSYRLHEFFLEYLRTQQHLLCRAECRAVYRCAARWYASNDCPLEAVGYYEKAEDYAGLAEVACTLTRMTPGRVAVFLLSTLERLPAAAFRANPALFVLRIKLLQNLSRFEEAAAQAQELLAEYEALPPTPEHCWLCSECCLHIGYGGLFTSLYTKEYDQERWFARGLEYFERSGRLMKLPQERTLLGSYVSRVGCPAAPGELERANALFAGYAPLAQQAKQGMFGGLAALAACEVAYFKTDLKNAERLATQSLHCAEECEQFQVATRALLFLLRIGLQTGNTTRLQTHLRQLKAQLKNRDYPQRHTLYEITVGWFYAQTRQTDHMAGWLRGGFEKSDLNCLSYGLECLVRAKYFLAEKRYAAALTALEQPDTPFGPEAFLLGKLELLALRAVCLCRTGAREEAFQALREAYALAQGDGLEMPFIELGRDMRTLTAAALRCEQAALPQDWLDRIRRKSSAYAKRLAFLLADPHRASTAQGDAPQLTGREKDILTQLCQGFSRAEIAQSNNLSVNTVKAAVQIIYAKLGVQNNAEAIRAAVERKLC